MPQSDLYRFVGFAGTLIRGIDDDDASADSKGLKIDAETKEKLRRTVRFFAEAGLNFHLQATHDNTARQLLDVLEEVQTVAPFARQRIAFARMEDATAETIARIKKLGGAISVQDRLALTGERHVELLGLEQARNAPPLRTMIDRASAGRRQRRFSRVELFTHAISMVVDHRARPWRVR